MPILFRFMILALLLALPNLASAQMCGEVPSTCGHIAGETFFVDEADAGGAWAYFQKAIDIPDVDGTYRLSFCLEMWDDAGGYMKIQNRADAEFEGGFVYDVDGNVIVQDGYGWDHYSGFQIGNGCENPFGYPHVSDVNIYTVNGDDYLMSGDFSYVSFDVAVTPYVPVRARLTAAVIAE